MTSKHHNNASIFWVVVSNIVLDIQVGGGHMIQTYLARFWYTLQRFTLAFSCTGVPGKRCVYYQVLWCPKVDKKSLWANCNTHLQIIFNDTNIAMHHNQSIQLPPVVLVWRFLDINNSLRTFLIGFLYYQIPNRR